MFRNPPDVYIMHLSAMTHVMTDEFKCGVIKQNESDLEHVTFLVFYFIYIGLSHSKSYVWKKKT